MNKYFPDRTRLLQIGLLLTGWLGFIYTGATILYFFRISLTIYSCWGINLFYIALTFYYLFKTKQVQRYSEIFYLFFYCIILVVLPLLISNWFIDYSYDGQSYHGEAIIQIYNGWNPDYDHIPGDGITSLVINSFSKASWITGGFLYKLTGSFECAKATNIIWMIANFCIACYLFSKWFNKSLSAIFSVLLACNPVWLNMYLGNMLDSQVANTVYIFILLLIVAIHEKNALIIPFLYMVIIYSTNLKFTVVGYNIVFIFFVLLFLMIRKKIFEQKVLIIHLCMAIFVAVTVIGYQTYTRNTLEHGHPFYPFKGKDKLNDSMSVLAMDYRYGNRFVNFVKSNFAATTYNQAYKQHLKYKIPFAISKYELERFAFAGVMIGGFGVWFSGIILISLFMLIWLGFKNKGKIFTEFFPVYFFIAAILASIFVNPYAYIARYISQYYLIPFAVLLLWWLTVKRKWFVFYLLIVVMVINSILICGYTYYNIVVSKKIKEQLTAIKTKNKTVLVNFGNHTSKRTLLEEYKIPYRAVGSFNQNFIPDTLFRSEVVYGFE